MDTSVIQVIHIILVFSINIGHSIRIEIGYLFHYSI